MIYVQTRQQNAKVKLEIVEVLKNEGLDSQTIIYRVCRKLPGIKPARVKGILRTMDHLTIDKTSPRRFIYSLSEDPDKSPEDDGVIRRIVPAKACRRPLIYRNPMEWCVDVLARTI